MRKHGASTLGKAAIVVGAALLMYAVAGASAVTYPQYSVYYAAGAAGIVALVLGFALGAIRLDK
jgi:hypothetical protein